MSNPMSNTPRPRGWARPVLAVAVVLALVALVALGSGARSTGADPARTAFDERGFTEFTAAVTFLILVAVILVGVRMVLRLIGDRDAGPEPEDGRTSALDLRTPQWLHYVIVGLVAVIVALCGFLLYLLVKALTGPLSGGGVESDGPSVVRAPAPVTEPTQAVYGNLLTIVLVVGSLVVLAVLVAAALVREREPDDDATAVVVDPSSEPRPEVDPFAVDLEALRRLAPAAGVVAAFAGAEAILRAAGFPDEWAETSAEFAARVGPTLPGAAPAALQHLSSLYHEAKFSEHPITDTALDEAVGALRTVRDAVRPLAERTATAEVTA